MQFEHVPNKCPKQFLYYTELICRLCEKNAEFHIFGWFPGLQNLDAFFKQILWS